MKSDKEILAVYKKNIELLKKHNRFYFEKDKPIISDRDYDELKKEVLNYEKKYEYSLNAITLP